MVDRSNVFSRVNASFFICRPRSMDTHGVEISLGRIFSTPCECAWRKASEGQSYSLSAAERHATRGFAPKREQEFVAGRLAAHECLARLRCSIETIPIGSDREPIWPDGIVGSISHSTSLAVAVAARAAEVVALGIDLEKADAVSPDLWPLILTEAERDWLDRKPDFERRNWATVMYSTKEAFFKYQFPITRLWIDYSAVTVAIFEKDGYVQLKTESHMQIGHRRSDTHLGRFDCGEQFVLAGFSQTNGQ